MNIHKLFKDDFDYTKIPISEVPVLLQQIEINIENYIRSIQNYSREKFILYGKPHLTKMRNIRKTLKKMAS